MPALRRILALATFVAVLSALVAGAASAEPKNQWPFTRPVDSRALNQSGPTVIIDPSPRPEPKNELPFTRRVDTSGASSGGAVTQAAGGGSDGFDWLLTAWVSLVALTLAGGAFVLWRGARLAARSRPAA